MSDLVLGEGKLVARFHDLKRSVLSGPMSDGDFSIDLTAQGLTVTQWVFMAASDFTSLTNFFADLVASWRGWEGEKDWQSVMHDLEILATHDGRGHCTLCFVVQDGLDSPWSLRAEVTTVDAGEDMRALADQVAAWTDAPRQ